ncbi:hypothetical protein [Variovorax sp. V15]|uniref:hypothetical protein n=1 Tax=Variovorax sp. V15 TaxID=3065952 RepID=UPI0034E8FEB3
MDLTPALIAAAATLMGAAIAATVSLIVTVLAKEQKVSDFRQAWIEELRNDIAEWIAEVAIISSLNDSFKQSGQGPDMDATERRYANFIKIRTLRSRIELRLNPSEHMAMFEAVKRVVDSMEKPDDRVKAMAAAVEESQRLLKREWLRVRKGEPAFYWTKRIAVSIVASTLTLIAWLTLRAL